MLHQALEGLKGKVAIRSTYDNYIDRKSVV